MLRMYFYLGELSKLSPSIFSIFLWVLLPNSTPQPDLLTGLPSAKWIFSYVMLRLLHCNICLKVLILDSLILLFIYLFLCFSIYLFILFCGHVIGSLPILTIPYFFPAHYAQTWYYCWGLLATALLCSIQSQSSRTELYLWSTN